MRLAHLASAIAFCAVVLTPFSAHADTPAPPLQISVAPLVVQFAIAPGGTASTRVVVRNTGTERAIVVARPIDWHVTLDGSVKTEPPGTEGQSSLDSYLRLSATEFALQPGETREMTLSLTLPSVFPATLRDYWGGYFVRASAAGASGAASIGVGANILTYETIGTPQRHVKVASLRVIDAGDRRLELTTRLLNDGRTFVRPQIRTVVAQAGRIVIQRDDSTPAIFAGASRVYARELRDLPPGAYAAQITIDYGGDTLIEASTTFAVR